MIELWLALDKKQFRWLDNAIGGKVDGITWHHTEIPGRMPLVPYDRTVGMWAHAPR